MLLWKKVWACILAFGLASVAAIGSTWPQLEWRVRLSPSQSIGRCDYHHLQIGHCLYDQVINMLMRAADRANTLLVWSTAELVAGLNPVGVYHFYPCGRWYFSLSPSITTIILSSYSLEFSSFFCSGGFRPRNVNPVHIMEGEGGRESERLHILFLPLPNLSFII